VTGTYKILRILKAGTAVKVDNSVAAIAPSSDSDS
jgi:hypothetical protein